MLILSSSAVIYFHYSYYLCISVEVWAGFELKVAFNFHIAMCLSIYFLMLIWASKSDLFSTDPEMQHEIDAYISAGRAIFDVKLWVCGISTLIYLKLFSHGFLALCIFI